MESKLPTREEALSLLTEYNSSDALIKHALAVEAAMRHIARKRGQDEDEWGLVGLIHDLDYERFPDEHCSKTGEILTERGWPERLVRAALGQQGGDEEPAGSRAHGGQVVGVDVDDVPADAVGGERDGVGLGDQAVAVAHADGADVAPDSGADDDAVVAGRDAGQQFDHRL